MTWAGARQSASPPNRSSRSPERVCLRRARSSWAPIEIGITLTDAPHRRCLCRRTTTAGHEFWLATDSRSRTRLTPHRERVLGHRHRSPPKTQTERFLGARLGRRARKAKPRIFCWAVTHHEKAQRTFPVHPGRALPRFPNAFRFSTLHGVRPPDSIHLNRTLWGKHLVG